MKKFNITVNGMSYEVDVEEVGGVSAPALREVPRPTPIMQSQSAKSDSHAVAKTPQNVSPAPKSASAPAEVPAGAATVIAPMPGTVLDIKVAVGDTVADGQVLMILEAMKMENEIMSPAAGTISSITVNKGASVNSGDVMIVIG